VKVIFISSVRCLVFCHDKIYKSTRANGLPFDMITFVFYRTNNQKCSDSVKEHIVYVILGPLS
jgi:hypothetical protein